MTNEKTKMSLIMGFTELYPAEGIKLKLFAKGWTFFGSACELL